MLHGSAPCDQERVLLRGLLDRNDSPRIKWEGVCQSRNSNLESLELFFKCYNVSVDEELQHALPKSVLGLWDQLQPSGVLDEVEMKISRRHSMDPIDLRVEITEKRESEARAGGDVSMRPASMHYQINDVACNIVYKPGHIDIKSC